MADHWSDSLPATLTYEDNGAQVPMASHPWIRESPDIGHFVNKSLQTHREVGARVPVKIETERTPDGRFMPKQASIDAWRKEHLPKLYDAGVLERPLAKPEDYGFTKPESMP